VRGFGPEDAMLARFYLLFGCLVLLGYVVSAYEGWEFFNPHRQPVPGASASGASGSSGSSGRWWWFSSRSGMGGDSGGK
jgi:hypothetical protein